MRKLVKGFFLFLILLVGVSYFVSAVSECYDGPGDKHGVEIDGTCYDCGEIDGVCPTLYGADCSKNPDKDCEEQNPTQGDARWYSLYGDDGNPSSEEITEAEINFYNDGAIFFAVVKSAEIKKEDKITFNIRRVGLLQNTIVSSSIIQAQGDGWASTIWEVDNYDFPNKGIDGEVAEFFFEAKKQNLDAKSGNLKLIVVSGNFCKDIDSCPDYKTSEDCGLIENSGGVGGPGEDLPFEGTLDRCYLTRDYIIQENVENPEESNCFGDQYNFCLWSQGKCIERNDFIPYEETETCVEIKCDYAEQGVEGSCEEGDEAVVVSYKPIEGETDDCPVLSRTYLCSSLVELPFFTTINVIIAVLVIAGVYFYLASKKKNKKRG